ncbi:transglycosylase SLT domain-containing protein [Streptomyces sp. NPDC050560]|uniref:transglycosylase SLT domain-containing protein n=1 Tax=Streptomyces sp. NPDC050560 TaxID=3365630 RepID=UPI003799875A
MFKRTALPKRPAILDKRPSLPERPAFLRRDTKPGSSITLTRTHKVTVAGVATLGAAALAVSLAPHDAEGSAHADAKAPVSWSAQGGHEIKDAHASVTNQLAGADQDATSQIKVERDAVAKAAAEKAEDKKEAAVKEAAQVRAAAVAKAEKEKAAQAHQAKEAASRAAERKPVYANNLNGWIKESLSIMKKHGIPGTYNGLYRNILRESSGNPQAINNWDVNARMGIPSKGLLQVIPPTFKTYHVSGTSWNIYDPVANITAAANYAADRYGSMDNVNSAY